MKIRVFILTTIILIRFLTNCVNPVDPIQPQEDKIAQIKETLLNNPPNLGDPNIRKQAILELDEILIDESLRNSQKVFDFYKSMIQNVNSELNSEVSEGIRIWMMYNHGFIVKTPENVFAFDLVDGYSVWQTSRSYQLPNQLVNEIEVMFVSHEHNDHEDRTIINKIKNNGGYVINTDDVDSIVINGLQIKLHYGKHSVLNRIFEVTTANGYKIVHTGDNQTSRALPDISDIDLLLLNAWVNESGLSTAVEGNRSCINILEPSVMIPGHIQELSHELSYDSRSRIPYEWSFLVDDVPIPSIIQVMAWGECYNYLK